MLILSLLYLVESLKYSLFFRLLSGHELKRKLPYFAGFFSYLLFLSLSSNPRLHSISLYIIVFLCTFLSFSESTLQKLFHSLMCLIFLTGIDGLMEFLLAFFLHFGDLSEKLPPLYKDFSVSLLSLAALLVLWHHKSRCLRLYEKLSAFIQRRIYLFIALLFIVLSLASASLNTLARYVDEKKIGLLQLMHFSSIISILIMAVFIIYIKKSSEEMKKLFDTERELKELLVRYYRDSLKKEKETRKYRHDLKNHLICLQSFLSEKKYAQAENYIKEMGEDLKDLQRHHYVTGNEILDAILHYYLPSLSKEVSVNVNGKFTKTPSIEATDQCRIFSNLVKNAVEELEKYSPNKKSLSVTIHSGLDFSTFIITNTLSEEGLLKQKDFFLTEKKDKKNHGLGLQTVASLTEKHGGSFEIKRTEIGVAAKVILKFDRSTS